MGTSSDASQRPEIANGRAGKAAALSEVNQGILRVARGTEANQGILRIGDESLPDEQEWDFFCECGRADCHAYVSLTLDAYVALQDGGGAVLTPGHRLMRDP